MDALRRATLYLLILHTSTSWSIAEFDQFPGFDDYVTMMASSTESKLMTSSMKVTKYGTSTPTTKKGFNEETANRKRTKPPSSVKVKNKTTTYTTRTDAPFNTNTIPYKPYVCPEDEKPYNIGPYEVPSQSDLALHIKTTLRTRFNSYHKKALFFLNDIKAATRATSEIEGRCPSRNRLGYKQCVKHVSTQGQVITKGLVTSLERQRHDVAAFTEGSICNFSSMKADPVQLIKILAMEEASLEFAISGFLRLLSACARYCKIDYRSAYSKKPTRHMSDQDLVVKHFLTHKNYAQLLKENP